MEYAKYVNAYNFVVSNADINISLFRIEPTVAEDGSTSNGTKDLIGKFVLSRSLAMDLSENIARALREENPNSNSKE